LFLNVRYASRIVAVSLRTRENILSLYPDAADRVEVIHHGVDSRFVPLDEKPPRGAFLARFDIPDKPFLFFVGTLRRKKNLRLLLEVFAKLPEPERSTHVLVLAGIKNPAWPELEQLVRSRELEGRVFLPGYVTDDDLVAFYNLATATIYPSMFEGFGLPPLESMACGTPVITSNGGAIPEVVGDAALTVPHDDRKKMEGAILSVLRDAKVRADLRKKGLKHAAKFTWDVAAERYLDLYRRLCT
jgi:glycosyltransferase involved in cell wall biosynthesis